MPVLPEVLTQTAIQKVGDAHDMSLEWLLPIIPEGRDSSFQELPLYKNAMAPLSPPIAIQKLEDVHEMLSGIEV